MCQKLTPRNELEETFGVSDALHEGARCESCVEPTDKHGTCSECQFVIRELEQDDVWPVWLRSLKGGAAEMDAFSDSLGGWEYVRAEIQYGRNDKGVFIDSANNLLFRAPGHRGFVAFTRHETGWPVVTVTAGDNTLFPDWIANFTCGTPLELILAACHAVIHQ
jgi:hypothetical protein